MCCWGSRFRRFSASYFYYIGMIKNVNTRGKNVMVNKLFLQKGVGHRNSPWCGMDTASGGLIQYCVGSCCLPAAIHQAAAGMVYSVYSVDSVDSVASVVSSGGYLMSWHLCFASSEVISPVNSSWHTSSRSRNTFKCLYLRYIWLYTWMSSAVEAALLCCSIQDKYDMISPYVFMLAFCSTTSVDRMLL